MHEAFAECNALLKWLQGVSSRWNKNGIWQTASAFRWSELYQVSWILEGERGVTGVRDISQQAPFLASTINSSQSSEKRGSIIESDLSDSCAFGGRLCDYFIFAEVRILSGAVF